MQVGVVETRSASLKTRVGVLLEWCRRPVEGRSIFLFLNQHATDPALNLYSRLLLDFSIFNEPKINGRATGKMNKHNRELRMHDSEVVDAKALVTQLRKGTITVTAGLDALLALPSVRAFNKKWDDEPLFANHAKRYILAFRPECGIAFHETDRYKNPAGLTGAKAKKNLSAIAARRDPSTFIEVGVFATRSFKKGEVINLRGGIADLTEEEDDELRDSGGRSDFSVLWSERKNCFCLLLGPARFVNHDCRNNVEFQLVGSNMSFKVLEDIEKDEEIFTHYGAHYFEMDNASCLCATCEQLKQGAFAPVSSRAKKAIPASPKPDAPPSRSRRASSPGPGPRRTSARTSLLPPPNYNENAHVEPVASGSGSGHTLTAQRSLSRARTGSLARSSSLSSLSSRTPSVRSRPPPSRINPTRGSPSVVDTLRAQPRIVVQPKLPPPPGYAMDYTWDAKKNVARYIGPLYSVCDEDKRKKQKGSAALSRSASAPSVVSLGKRKRAEMDSPQPRGTARTLAKSKSAPAPAKKPRSTLVQLKKVRVGERSSGRLRAGKGTASARDRNFAKLNEALGQDGDSSDLSDGAEEQGDEESELSEAEKSEAEEAEEEAVEAEEEAPTTRSKAKLDKGKGKAIGEADDIEMKGVESTASPAPAPSNSASPSLPSTMSAMRSLRSRTSTSTAHLRAITLDIGSSTSTPAEESPSPQLRQASVAEGSEDEQDPIALCPTPGSGTKSDDPLPLKKPRQPISTPNFYSSAADSSSSNSNSNQNPSDGRGTTADRSANNNHEGSSFWSLLALSGRQHPLMVPRVSSPSAHTPSSTAPTPPSATSTDAGTEASSSTSKLGPPIQLDSAAGSSRKGKRAGRLSDGQDPLSANNPRSTRRQPKLEESPAASTSAPVPKAKRARSAASNSPAASSASNARSDIRRRSSRLPVEDSPRGEGAQTATPPPSLDGRRTRSQPIPGRLEDVLSAPETLAATGGFDYAKGKYITKHEQLRSPSADPRPHRPSLPASSSAPAPSVSRFPRSPVASSSKPRRLSHSPATAAPVASRSSAAASASASPAPPEGVRATRRSFPIAEKLRDIIYSSSALAATGGFDFEKGKYVGASSSTLASLSSASPAPVPAQPPSRDSSTFTAKPSSSKRDLSASASPRPASPASGVSTSPPEGIRATRRSFPINQPIQQLIYSPAATSVAGGWDPASGKYISTSRARKAAAGERGAAEASTKDSRAE
ncbi:SPOSA6832_01139 [Sporobolomyces salmonicolor]|uniref:SPOSA6832_01139-mRNA-1:cds n=1 Tax=Sporidiobolus salmonicolor TaxID=5005 RepID=A0A0D6EHY4_SPOSA|nr:SPOSA6832_01139 [Sporobolomyces salmonicolor]